MELAKVELKINRTDKPSIKINGTELAGVTSSIDVNLRGHDIPTVTLQLYADSVDIELDGCEAGILENVVLRKPHIGKEIHVDMSASKEKHNG